MRNKKEFASQTFGGAGNLERKIFLISPFFFASRILE
jgi:hypothetical protein